jgi:hypothetical protein
MLRSFEAGEIVKAAWQPATESWTVQDPLGADHAATALETGKLSVHDLVVGRPVEGLGGQVGLGPDLADSLAYAAARTVPLPGDRQVNSVVKVVRVVGVVVEPDRDRPAPAWPDWPPGQSRDRF